MMKLPSVRNRLPRDFFDRNPSIVARELLGKPLIRRSQKSWIGGRIVETEAYLSRDDLASHSSRGKTPSNAAMFGRPGTIYVYPIHAKYCLNAVTEAEGVASAVLIRAIEPVWGLSRMKTNRGHQELHRLTRGPAMLCQALDIDRRFDQADLLGPCDVRILQDDITLSNVTSTQRIGVTRCKKLRLRFFIDGNSYVSGRVGDHQNRPTRST
ncbi:MAG: DNA-3-methyladenine glycosylase [Rubripirellula sp.]